MSDKNKNSSTVEKKPEEVKEGEEKKEKWSSNIEFMLTCLSYVIGFGKVMVLSLNSQKFY